jgi:hypothetical protein
MQQRGIPPLMIDLLHRCGSTMRCGGADRLFFDKAARRRLKACLGGDRGLKAVEPWLDIYLVQGDDGAAFTVAHQQRRFRHP